MNKSIVIHQPNFLPRLKVFIKIAISDEWIIYDNVQYVRREWQNRVFLRDSEQRDVLFTAPICKADYLEKINNILLSNVPLLNEHLHKHFEFNYAKAPYYDWILTYLDEVSTETQNESHLYRYNVACTNIALNSLDLKPQTEYASQMVITSTDRNGKLVELCQKGEGANYICGSGGKSYIDESIFRESDINVLYYDYSKIDKFNALNLSMYRNRSFLDFIAFNGPDVLRDLIIEEQNNQIQGKLNGGFGNGQEDLFIP